MTAEQAAMAAATDMPLTAQWRREEFLNTWILG
jgi:hypothetical protein